MSDDAIFDRLDARMDKVIRRMTALTWMAGINVALTASALVALLAEAHP